MTGPRWHGELLEFCERALEQLGIPHLSLATHRPRPRRNALKGIPGLWRLGKLANEPALRRWRQGLASEFQRAVDEWKPTILLSILCWGDQLDAVGLSEMPGCIRVAWLMDDPFLDDGYLASIIGRFDLVFTIDESWSTPIKLMTGVPVETLPCAGDPFSHFPTGNPGNDGIIFVGSSYSGTLAGIYRQEILESVADLGLRIYGDTGWMNASKILKGAYCGGPVASEKANSLYNSAAIALNIHHHQFRSGTSLRTFALCCAGAFQLVDWRPGLDKYFNVGHELVAFESLTDLRKKALHYLRDGPSRERIARAGLHRVLSEHTYTNRMGYILSRVRQQPRR